MASETIASRRMGVLAWAISGSSLRQADIAAMHVGNIASSSDLILSLTNGPGAVKAVRARMVSARAAEIRSSKESMIPSLANAFLGDAAPAGPVKSGMALNLRVK